MNTAKNISAKSETQSLQEGYGLSLIGFYELTKPRLSLLSVFTASLGFLIHDPLAADLSLFLSLTIGTALSAGGAAARRRLLRPGLGQLQGPLRGARRPGAPGISGPFGVQSAFRDVGWSRKADS